VVGIALVAALAVTQLGAVIWQAVRHDSREAGAAVAAVPTLLRPPERTEPSVAAYEGLGAWVDLYDVGSHGGEALVTPAAVDAMASAGVDTLYLQVARDNGDGPAGLTDPALAARFLVRAHERDVRVVGWYLPRFGDVARDLDYLQAIARFEVLGHRFDGIAVDIEWTETVADHVERSARLVELSQGLRDSVDADALGAIVLPPVAIEVVNPAYWPEFPWGELEPLYDAWLPMGYWTQRTVASGYRDAATYTTENIARLRDHVGADAAVHAIGGLGEQTTDADIAAFAAAVDDGGAVGASIYDWNTIAPAARQQLADAFSR
jgi:hypothetical protein